MSAADPFAAGGRQDDAELGALEQAFREVSLKANHQGWLPQEIRTALVDEHHEAATRIHKAAPSTLRGVIIKLRLLADEDYGLEARPLDNESDFASLRSVA